MSLKTLTQTTEVGEGKARTPLIIAENLSVKYDSEKEKRNDFKSLVHNYLSFKKINRYETIWALNDVSFTVYQGEVLGVIGANGAGKTTLCRAVLGLMKPDAGSIRVNGEISSLLSLGTGFNEDLSGRENILLNGLMLGFSHSRLKDLQPSIEEFTGLGRFLDQPIKHYSAGMKARLGFSIAAALEPDILVIDEVLGTGDLEFKDRAVKRLYELVSGSGMVMVVSHDINFVEKNCTRALWLDQGRVVALGNPPEVVQEYREFIPTVSQAKKRIVNIRETRTRAGLNETIKAKNLGVKFNLGKESLWALKDVSFKVRDQEILGLIGPNGAGKTTLCRTLSGLYRPDSGYLRVKGKVNALLSFNLGFNEQLTGYDNIYLNGMMLGLSKKKIKTLVEQIVEFSELEKAIHRPVKTYSSGMRSRLGFSIAANLKPDLFVVDEALTAGDLAFQEKATVRMQGMLGEAKTVVLVTHSLDLVEKACTRAIWLNQGRLQYDGEAKEAVKLYTESVKEYQRMRKALPLNKDVRLQQAVELFGRNQLILADELLGEYLRDFPEDLIVLMEYALIAEARKNWGLAQKRWLKLSEASKNIGEPIPQQVEQHLSAIELILSGRQG